MRFDTHRASAYLVEQLMQVGAEILDDGGDIILLKDPSGARVSVHLIESPLPLYEMKTILTKNHKDDLHTLFIFWCPMLLPVDGAWYEPDDWMAAVLSLHSGKIYGYELYGSDVFVFPVYFEQRGTHWRVRYGDTIEAAFLECHAVHTSAPAGYWRVADFSPRPPKEYWHKTTAESAKPSPTRLAAYYGILGVSQDAAPTAIKRAYRVLARKYHPDLNTAPDATERMQEINVAYTWIMRQFEDDAP